MRYKPRQYAEALVAVLADAESTDVHGQVRAFCELLARHRMLGKAEYIIRSAERLLAKRSGVQRVQVASVDTLSPMVRDELTGIFGGKVWLSEERRPNLLAGIRILIDDETLIDASGARRLSQLFPQRA